MREREDITGKRVKAWLYGMVGINLAIVVMIVLFFDFRDRESAHVIKVITRYHDTSELSAREGLKIIDEIGHIRHDSGMSASNAISGDGITKQVANRKTADLLIQLNGIWKTIAGLQREHAAPEFDLLSSLISQEMANVTTAFTESNDPSTGSNNPLLDEIFSKQLEPLALRLEQLARLHRVSRERLISASPGASRDVLVVSVSLLTLFSLLLGLTVAQRISAISSGWVTAIKAMRQSESKLAHTARSLESAQQIARLGSWEWDMASDEQHWSDETYRIFGLEPGSLDRLEGATFTRFVHPDDRASILEQYQQALASPRPLDVEYRTVGADGMEKFVAVRGELIRDEKGEPVLTAGTIQDISERKKAEIELAMLNTELELRVEERTAELKTAQGELVRRERMATLGQLTATVSHELRNPLGVIRTSIYSVEKRLGTVDEKLAAAISRINRSIARCDRIVDELLDFTRMREAQLECLVFDDWLSDLLDEQPPPAIAVERNFSASGISVHADPDRLRRAMLNIYENACQAMVQAPGRTPFAEGHRLTISTRLNDDRLEAVFDDTGPGIPAESSGKIFEPLFSTKSFGVGLGLTVVRQIMDQHNGGVTIGASPAGGAQFILWLPLEINPQREIPKIDPA